MNSTEIENQIKELQNKLKEVKTNEEQQKLQNLIEQKKRDEKETIINEVIKSMDSLLKLLKKHDFDNDLVYSAMNEIIEKYRWNYASCGLEVWGDDYCEKGCRWYGYKRCECGNRRLYWTESLLEEGFLSDFLNYDVD